MWFDWFGFLVVLLLCGRLVYCCVLVVVLYAWGVFMFGCLLVWFGLGVIVWYVCLLLVVGCCFSMLVVLLKGVVVVGLLL